MLRPLIRTVESVMTEWFKLPISKAPVPKDQVYPLTLQEIATLLRENRLTRVRSVALLPKTRRGQFVRAEYQGENAKNAPLSNEPHRWNGTISIWIFGVSKKERAKMVGLVRKEVLPRVIEWVRELDTKNENWRQSDHNLLFKYEKGEVKMTLDDNRFWE